MPDAALPYPGTICADCDMRHGRRQATVATFHDGICGICGRGAAVTEPRDYGHLTPDMVGQERVRRR